MPPMPGDDVSDVANVERQRLRALVDADMIVAEMLHASDFQLITPSGRALTRTEYLDPIATGAFDYVRWEPGDIAVRTYGGSAVLRYQADLQIAVDALLRPPFRCWHTDLYEWRDDRWQVIWSQATQIE